MDTKRFYRNVLVVAAVALFFFLLIQAERQGATVFKEEAEIGFLPPLETLVSPEAKEQINVTGGNKTGEGFTVLFNSADEISFAISNNFQAVFDYMDIEGTQFDVNNGTPVFDGCEAVFIAFSDLSVIKDSLPDLLDYVRGGGKVTFCCQPDINEYFAAVYRQLGILEYYSISALKSERFVVTEPGFLLGVSPGDSYEVGSSYAFMQLSGECKVYMEAETSDGARAPLVWKTGYGDGFFLVYNHFSLADKSNRGLIAALILEAAEEMLYPVLNAMVMEIDDFPSPYPSGYDENILQTYNRNIVDFFTDIWWRDMKRISSNYGIRYTALIIISYNDLVTPPFPPEGDDELIRRKAAEIQSLGGEIGIHGYNHMPLCPPGYMIDDLDYVAFPDFESMRAAVKAVYEQTVGVLPGCRLQVYVPPSNFLSTMGREALKQEIPELKVIAAIYSEADNNNPYVQEFAESPDGIIEFPRLGAGFVFSEKNKWTEFSLVTLHGLVHHFIHPDDVLDPERSLDKGWDELYKIFDSFVSRVSTCYPFLRNLTTSEGGLAVQKYVRTHIDTQSTENGMTVQMETFYEDQSFFLKSMKTAVPGENCSVEKIDESFYLVTPTDAEFSIKYIDGR